ncbi:MAG: hypothetical protein PHS54_05700, partial [Clostridia bacterium]|nr:hypothetical protein [Clostridia bacterium]
RNSIKLLIANFSTVWKLILYYIIVIGVVVGLLLPFFGVLGSALNSTGDLNNLVELFTSFNVSINFFSFVAELNLLFVSIFNSIIALFVSNVWVAIYLVFVLFYLIPVLFGLADLPVGHTLFGYMSSLTKYNFTGSYVSMLGRSVRYQLFKNLVHLPLNIAIFVVLYFTLNLVTIGGILVYFLPIIIILPLILLISFKKTLFSGWMPAIVVYDYNMFVAFGKGIQAVFRRFFKVFSTSMFMTLIIFAICYLFGTYALLITIPLAAMFFYVFEMVMFYGSQGMRFYVDLDTIVKPKLLEERDYFNKVKNII